MTLPISREAFDSADQGTKLLLIYDVLTAQHEAIILQTSSQLLLCDRRCEKCELRFGKLERRKALHTGIAAVGGLVGGFVAVIAKAKLWE